MPITRIQAPPMTVQMRRTGIDMMKAMRNHSVTLMYPDPAITATGPDE